MWNILYNQLYFSDNTFYAYTIGHLLMISMLALIGSVFFSFIKKTDSKSINSIKTGLLILLFLQQFGLYSWYFVHSKFDVVDALPCYPCRIWQLCAILYLLTGKKEFFAVNFLMGIPSSLLAFAIPDTSGLGFPNIMFIQFFVGHSMLILVPLFAVVCERQKIEKKMLQLCMLVYALYIFVVKFLNSSLGSNYGYVSAPPYNNALFNSIKDYYLFVYMGFGFIALIIWYYASEKLLDFVEQNT